MQNGATQQEMTASGSVLALSLSEGGMIGLHAVVHQYESNMSKASVACLMGQDNARLYSIMQRILSENMSPADLKAANAFFDSPTGRKYAKRDLAEAYKVFGQPVPQPVPVLSAAELNQVAEFTATPAGQMLITNKFMNKATSLPVVRDRINELMKECGARHY